MPQSFGTPEIVLVIGGPEPFRETTLRSLAEYAYRAIALDSSSELERVPEHIRQHIGHVLLLDDIPAIKGGNRANTSDPRIHLYTAKMLREDVTIFGLQWSRDDPMPVGLEPATYVPLNGFQVQDIGRTLASTDYQAGNS